MSFHVGTWIIVNILYLYTAKRSRKQEIPPSQSVPPHKRPCPTPTPTPTPSEDGDVLQSLLDRRTTLLDIGNSDTDFLHCLLDVKVPTPVPVKTIISREDLMQKARLDFEMCMVTDHMGNLWVLIVLVNCICIFIQ